MPESILDDKDTAVNKVAPAPALACVCKSNAVESYWGRDFFCTAGFLGFHTFRA